MAIARAALAPWPLAASRKAVAAVACCKRALRLRRHRTRGAADTGPEAVRPRRRLLLLAANLGGPARQYFHDSGGRAVPPTLSPESPEVQSNPAVPTSLSLTGHPAAVRSLSTETRTLQRNGEAGTLPAAKAAL